MDPKETERFEKLYQRHLRLLKLKAKARKRETLIQGRFVEHEIISIVARTKSHPNNSNLTLNNWWKPVPGVP